VDLISDPDLILHKELWAYGEKNNYGKIVTWVIRSTFLFDREGRTLQEWRNVKAKWHAAKVLREITK
jgi:peroxiredoxin Q/BCP